MDKRKLKLNVIIEQDEDGAYIATIPELKSCYTYAHSIEELMPRVKEVIGLCLEEEGIPESFEVSKKFVGFQQVEVEV